MPPRKRQTIYGLPGSESTDVVARLQQEIDVLLTAANDGQMDCDAILVALSEGQPCRLRRAWPRWAVEALANLISLVNSGAYQLRRCERCNCWMLVHDRRQRICRRPSCPKKARTDRQRERRKVKRDREKTRAAIARERALRRRRRRW